MLTSITIRDLVIVRSLDLAFHGGLTALTGETGAGKSILIDALAIALGERADQAMIRQGADKAEVIASFEVSNDTAIGRWLDERDLWADGECLLRRVLVKNGRSRAYINGSPSPRSSLRELGEMLVDIHGQHAHQSLLRPSAQRQLLDEFAGLTAATRELRQHFRTWQDTRARREALYAAGQDRASRLDYLHFQIAELEGLPCEKVEIEALEKEHGRLAHAEHLLSETGQVLSALEDGQASPLTMLNHARARLGELSTLDDRLGETCELLEAAAIQIDEAVNDLRHYGDGVELDPDRLRQVDELLGRLHDAARKHRVAAADLGPLRESLAQEAQTLNQADDALAALDAELTGLEATYSKAARTLSAKRRRAAVRLSETVTDSMQTLNMAGGRFRIECQTTSDTPGPEGIDRVEFLVAANPGQAEGALGEVASGGELSRISLAIQVATAGCGKVPTLIFDEVDVGIGGAVAEIVGQLLQRLGGDRQILCVTHLPQVASQAHRHLRVDKLTDGRSTETRIEILDEGSRIDEIARMLGGIDITSQTRKHAEEMIQQAQQTC